jgi:hypothetical protein
VGLAAPEMCPYPSVLEGHCQQQLSTLHPSAEAKRKGIVWIKN